MSQYTKGVVRRAPRADMKTTTTSCRACTKTVYPMEALALDQAVFHKTCFKCSVCCKVITLGTYASLDGIAGHVAAS